MTKQNQIFCIDLEIIEKLKKENNKSALVNRLLIQYFEGNDIKTMTKEQIEKLIAVKKLDLEYENKKKEIENGKY